MPGWHEKVKDLVAENRLVLLGVTQEQHAERCVLFAKWKQFDWPILHDPINALGCQAVPITIAIDEKGVVQSTRPNEKWLRDEFIGDAKNTPPSLERAAHPSAGISKLKSHAEETKTVAAYQALGDAIMHWQPKDGSDAVAAYRAALAKEDSADLHFRLGVALRHRFDSANGDDGDFSDAVSHWVTALGKDPNQYIWRRRIQQYGPRLDKPYPFYDWVDQALADLADRGEKFELNVQLSGAEIARPGKITSDTAVAKNPDPDGEITRDSGQFVKLTSTVVPSSKKGQGTSRLHLMFEPQSADWNNESGPMQVWFNRSEGYSTPTSLLEHHPQQASAESREKRTIEAEFTVKGRDLVSVQGFVLYYICEKSDGQCMFRRQDFSIPIKIN